MAKKYLDDNGLLYFWQKIRNTFVSNITYDSSSYKIQKVKKTGTNGAEETTDIVTLAKVATSGSYNDLSNKPTIPTLKNVFGKVKVGSTTVEADTTQDTLELVAGSNVTLTPDATNDKVTIAATDTKYTAASATPLMDGTAAVGSSTKYAREDHVHPTDTSRVPTSRTIDGIALTADITLPDATTTKSGHMSATDKAALNKITTPADNAGYVLTATSEGFGWAAPVFVQSDWNQTTTTAASYIINKPTLGAAAAKGVVTSITGDSTNLPTVTAVRAYVNTAVTGVASFQGTAPTSFAPTNYKKGWYWVVGTAGTYAGQTCEPGDMIFCVKDYGSAFANADFDAIQTNLDITSITNSEIDTIVAA